MKKYIFSVLMAAMAAFTFSSCEDVPAPYTMPEKPTDGGTTTEGNPTGTGTATDPFNCAAAVQYCNSLESGVESTQDVYVKGKVQSIEEQFSANYGNCSVTLVDEDSKVTFKVWRAFYFDNKKWAEGGKTINVGDELVFCGKVMNYAGNTPETVQSKAYLYSINGETSGNGGNTPAAGEAKGTGTEADPFNSVAAQNYTTALAADQTTEQEFYIKGKIQSIDTQFAAQYGNASVHIADDANSQQFYIFRIYYFGGEKWKEGDGLLKVGDEIVVCAKLVNFKGNTPETSQGGKLISVNGKTSISGGDTPSTPDTPSTSAGVTINGTTVTLAGSATAGEIIKVDLNTLGLAAGPVEAPITLSDGTTITFELGDDGKTAPAFNASTKGIRVYANNKIVFNGKSNIAKIVMECDSYNGTEYVGNATATVAFSGKTATYTNLFTGTGGGTQLRVKTIEIFYAK